MGAFARMKPKPHEEMNTGKPAKKGQSMARKNQSNF